jgi:hypothetical protein
MNAKNDNVILLRNVRLSFPVLWTPKAGDEPGAKPKYAATFLLDKKANAREIAALKAGIEKVKTTSDKLKGNKRPIKSPLREGSEKSHLDGYDESNMFIIARNHKKVGVVDAVRDETGELRILTENDGRPYAGCIVNARVECYGYVHPKSGPGISFSLLNVQFVKDGDAFGDAPTSPTEGFEAIESNDEI